MIYLINKINRIKNRTAADSSFRYASFGMTVAVLRDRAKATAALKALPLLLPPYPTNRRHSELRGTKQEESHPINRNS
jgi:hypothetical protein